jgi:transferrin binding protein
MSAFIKNLAVGSVLLALSACASGGSVGTPNDVLLPNGDPAPRRNTILTEISYLHPAESNVDEVFDVAAVTMTISQDPNSSALLFTEGTRGFFGDGNSFIYDASADTFTFDITSGSNTLTGSIGPLLTVNPVNAAGLEYGAQAYLMAAFPASFGLAAGTYLGNPQAVDAYLTSLATQGDPASTALLDALLGAADVMLAADFFGYTTTGGVDVYQLKLANNAITSNYTSLAMWFDETTPGEITYGVGVYGERTPVYDVPITGSARYVGTTVGQLWNENRVNYLTGGVTFDMDFLSRQLDFTYIAEVGEIGIDGQTIFLPYDTFTGTGEITNDTFFGEFTSDTDNTMVGEFDGAFFGLAADEVGGTFVFGNGDAYGIGGFIAVKEDN